MITYHQEIWPCLPPDQRLTPAIVQLTRATEGPSIDCVDDETISLAPGPSHLLVTETATVGGYI